MSVTDLEVIAPPARSPITDGIRDAAPVLFAYIPFGLALGAALGAAGISRGVAWSSSPLMFAGAAQLVAVQLLSAGAASVVVVLSAVVVNARHLLYSASLSSSVAGWRPRSRWFAPYLLADPVYVLAERRFLRDNSADARRYYFAMGLTMWAGWQALTGAGLVLGGVVPASLHLERAAPLTFLILLLPMLTTRSARAAAAVAGMVALVGSGLPYGLGMLAGALAGVAAGGASDAKGGSDA
jgi:predicted branched-subunit amino acid permease